MTGGGSHPIAAKQDGIHRRVPNGKLAFSRWPVSAKRKKDGFVLAGECRAPRADILYPPPLSLNLGGERGGHPDQ